MKDEAVAAVVSHIRKIGNTPPETHVREAAHRFLVDTLAVGFSGYHEPAAGRLRQSADQWGTGSDAGLLGTTERMPATSSAFCNAFQMHCQEFDCLHEKATVHAMAVLTGSLVALSDRESLTLADALKACVIGVDVAAGLGLAATKGLAFFRPATAGAIGSAAALGACLNMDDETLNSFLGLAHSQLAGTMQAHVEGSVALPLQIGAAARSVVTALDLVRSGMEGPHNILTGPFGYFSLFEPKSDIDGFIAGLEGAPRILELSHKPFPTGRAAHAILDGIRTIMRQNHLTVDDVDEVRAAVPPLTRRLVDRPIRNAMSANYARLCIYYLAALMLRDGFIDMKSFAKDNLEDTELRRISEKLVVTDNGIADPNALSPQSISLRTKSGQVFDLDMPATLGHPDNPLSHDGQIEKITGCLTPGAETFGEKRAGADLAAELLQIKGNMPLSELLESLAKA